jgi:N-acetylmuramoyl-L-alanine amidase
VSIYLADVSEFQPDVQDKTYLAWSKAVIVRAAYGAAHDDKAWYGGARRAAFHAGGVKFLGIYQFLAAGQDGAAQARAFHALIGDIQPGEVLIADFEQGAKPMLTAWYNQMLALYGQHIRPYLWTYSGALFGAMTGVLPVDWIAAYGSSEPASPHTLWQFTDSFTIPGIGKCDASIFHGTIDQLAARAYPAPGTPLTPDAAHPYAAPAGLEAGPVIAVPFSWKPVPGISGYTLKALPLHVQTPATGIVQQSAAAPTATLRLTRGRQYQVDVWAEGAKGAGAHASTVITV